MSPPIRKENALKPRTCDAANQDDDGEQHQTTSYAPALHLRPFVSMAHLRGTNAQQRS
jgi:hypothetical protein